MLGRIIDALCSAFAGRLKARLREATAETLTEFAAEVEAALVSGDVTPALAGATPAVADRPRRKAGGS